MPGPADLQRAFGAAIQHHQAGRLAEAEAIYRDILAATPNNADVLHLAGVIAGQTGRHQAAIDLIGKAISRVKDKPPAAFHNNIGLAYLAMGQLDLAAKNFARAIALKPDYAEAHYGLGNTFAGAGRSADALIAYDKALAIRPSYPDALNNRGNVQSDLRRFEAALASLDKAVALAPNYVDALNNRATVLQKLGRYDDALVSYDKAVALGPRDANIFNNRSELLERMGHTDRGVADLEKVLELAPDYEYALGDLVVWKMKICDWDGLSDQWAKLEAGVRSGARVLQPFSGLAVPMTPADYLQCAKIYVADKYPTQTPLWRGEGRDHDKIRVAYVSGDFNAHATAFLMAELFERHDRSRFEITAISLTDSDGSTMRARLEASFDRFIDVARKSDHEIATMMRAAEIDIAIDLKGFTRGCPLGIFAWRPAPVQASYLGFAGTVGADFIDYILADATVLPPEDRAFYTEKIVTLPDTYQVTDSRRTMAEPMPTRAEAGLPETGFVFCCFNNSFKFTPDMFDIWMQLLNEVPGSVLWLYAATPSVQENLKREAAGRGVSADRLVFAQQVPQAEHLSRIRLADLFLDTLPYNAHTTASDSLWAGVPLVTCPGGSFQARVAASLLKAAGLPELITASRPDYKALALKLATDPAMAKAIRAKLAANRATSPLFDADRFRRHIESAYTTMYDRQRSGKTPADFAVPPIG